MGLGMGLGPRSTAVAVDCREICLIWAAKRVSQSSQKRINGAARSGQWLGPVDVLRPLSRVVSSALSNMTYENKGRRPDNGT